MAELFPLKDNPPEAIAVFEELCEAVKKGEAKLVPLNMKANDTTGTISCLVRVGDVKLEGDHAVMPFKTLAMLLVSKSITGRKVNLPDDVTFDSSDEELDFMWQKNDEEERKEKWRSPLDDPDCPFALESDEHPK